MAGLPGRGATARDPEDRRVRGQSCCGQGDVHVGDQMLRGLEGRDRPPELVTQLRVVDGAFQHGLPDPDQVERSQCHRGVGHPAQRRRQRPRDRHRQQRVGGDDHIVEMHDRRPGARPPSRAVPCSHRSRRRRRRRPACARLSCRRPKRRSGRRRRRRRRSPRFRSAASCRSGRDWHRSTGDDDRGVAGTP